MAALATITVGDTRRTFVPTITDENGNIVSLSATISNHKLQGMSKDLPLITINLNSSAVSSGQITFQLIGGVVTQANLTAAGVKRATFDCKVRFVDGAGAVGFTDGFQFIFEQDPLQPA